MDDKRHSIIPVRRLTNMKNASFPETLNFSSSTTNEITMDVYIISFALLHNSIDSLLFLKSSRKIVPCLLFLQVVQV